MMQRCRESSWLPSSNGRTHLIPFLIFDRAFRQTDWSHPGPENQKTSGGAFMGGCAVAVSTAGRECCRLPCSLLRRFAPSCRVFAAAGARPVIPHPREQSLFCDHPKDVILRPATLQHSTARYFTGRRIYSRPSDPSFRSTTSSPGFDLTQRRRGKPRLSLRLCVI